MLILIKRMIQYLIIFFPIIVLFCLVLTGFDLAFLFYGADYSFNFVYIIIFFWILKNPDDLGYGLIFLAGIFNDVVQNFPIGISSLNFLSLCVIAAFVRARTLNSHLLYDWITFLMAILIVSSINFSILTVVFNFPIKYTTLMSSSFITFLIYPIFSKLFTGIYLLGLRQKNAE